MILFFFENNSSFTPERKKILKYDVNITENMTLCNKRLRIVIPSLINNADIWLD